MKTILLDTNAYTALLAGDKSILDAVSRAETVLMPVFVLGELYYGFKGGSKEKRNRSILSRFLQKPSVRSTDAGNDTAEYFGMVKDSLKKQGTPIPINDVWIAAQAMEHGAQLITFDKHFSKIAGLNVWEG